MISLTLELLNYGETELQRFPCLYMLSNTLLMDNDANFSTLSQHFLMNGGKLKTSLERVSLSYILCPVLPVGL